MVDEHILYPQSSKRLDGGTKRSLCERFTTLASPDGLSDCTDACVTMDSTPDDEVIPTVNSGATSTSALQCTHPKTSQMSGVDSESYRTARTYSFKCNWSTPLPLPPWPFLPGTLAGPGCGRHAGCVVWSGGGGGGAPAAPAAARAVATSAATTDTVPSGHAAHMYSVISASTAIGPISRTACTTRASSLRRHSVMVTAGIRSKLAALPRGS
mmetsp:Transcript_9520/g.24545  ORF Transcript_9520/g.24545 Transcript_9520/m.24545 type:complete len:212 (-) Transcript_9520:241-876(-)